MASRLDREQFVTIPELQRGGARHQFVLDDVLGADALSQKFVEDYTPLTDRLRTVLNLARTNA